MGNPLDDKSVNVTIPQLQKTGAQVIAGQPWPSDEIKSPPLWPDRPTTGRNLKLDGHLDALVDAEMRGEAEEFARPRCIELLDGSVRVEIECQSGHAEEVARAASAFGVVELTYRDVVQAVVPITNLNALSKVEGIRFIRMPIRGEEEAE